MLAINRQTPTTILSLIFLLSIISAACRRTPEKINTQLNHAETIIESHPDSALSIIESIDTLQIHGKKDRARYSLLHTMALDKMLVDITDMNILTPALDYYISNGSPDQRMRTRYYEGVIRRAIGDDDGAMTCFLDAVSDTTKIYKDSLGLALVYLQQGALYYKQYRIDDFIKTTEKACSIYEAIDINNPNLILSYLKIIIGSNLNSYYSKADSIYNICLPLVKETSDDYQDLQNVHLISLIDRNDIPAIRQYLNSIVLDSIKSPLHNLDIAWALCITGNIPESLKLLNRSDSAKNLNPTKYLSIKSDILDSAGLYRESRQALSDYVMAFSLEVDTLHKSDLLFSEKKFAMQLDIEKNRYERRKLLFIGYGIFLCALMIIVYLHSRNKIEKSRRIEEESRHFATQQKELNIRLELDRERLNSEKQRLEIQNNFLEIEKQSLENDNLRLQLDELVRQKNDLEDELNNGEYLTEDLKQIIRNRLDIFNTILTEDFREIKFEKRSWRKLRDFINKDKQKFLESTMTSITITSPGFIRYIRNQGLDDTEINIACLYAVGFKGKEVSSLMGLRSLYNYNLRMRKKIGLFEQSINLDRYIRNCFLNNGEILNE